MRHLSFIALIVLATACSPRQEAQPIHQHRIIHENDGTDILLSIRPETLLEDLNARVDMAADGGVTTFLICPGSDDSWIRSKYSRLIGSRADDKSIPCKAPATCSIHRKIYDNIIRLEEHGTDILKASLIRARERGMEAFITYRMNDLHATDTNEVCPHAYTSDFWIEHPEYWTNDKTLGWHASQAFDFAHPEIRQRKLDMITEQLENYADYMDGYLLDFMRFFVYYKRGEGRKHAPEMTQLVRDIRKKVNETSARQGRKILLAARVAPTVYINEEKGLDIREWLKEGLFDFISIGTHWQGDPQMPVKSFRDTLGTDLHIPLYSTIDEGGFSPYRSWSEGMFRAQAAYHYDQQSDGLYLFNFYFEQETLKRRTGKPIPVEEGCLARVGKTSELLKEISNPANLVGRNKIYSLSERINQYDVYMNSPLPLRFEDKGQALSAPFYIADDVEKVKPQEAVLFFLTEQPATFSIKVNGTDLTEQRPSYVKLYGRFHESEDKDEGFDRMQAFIIPAGVLRKGNNDITFTAIDAQQKAKVQRIEIALNYGDVETHGYF